MSRREEGVAVVMALGSVALLMLVAVVGGAAVAIIATHRQVQSAADLAALAGASAQQEGGPACQAAAHIGQRNGAVVTRCESGYAGVSVVVERRLPAVFGGRLVRARARAGPVEPTP